MVRVMLLAKQNGLRQSLPRFLQTLGKTLTYSKNGNTYELRSAGIDGQVNTDDDVVLEGA